jgi:hypothetical protein
VGYLFMFTAAGGQTAGKMLMDIRVVDAGHARARVTLRWRGRRGYQRPVPATAPRRRQSDLRRRPGAGCFPCPQLLLCTAQSRGRRSRFRTKSSRWGR